MKETRNPNPRITWLLATYNREKFLRKTFENFREFMRPDEEFIVIDGGSTDGSLEIIRENADMIDLLISEPDLGEAHAFNKGFLLARGEIIKCLSDDDYFYPERMRQALDHLTAHPELDVLMCRGEFHSGRFGYQPDKGFPLDVPYTSSFKYVYRYRALSGIGMFFRRRILPQVGLLDVNSRAVDYVFIDQFFKHRLNVEYYDVRVYRHTQQADSGMSKNKAAYNRDIINILKGHGLYWQAYIRIPRFGSSIFSKALYRLLEPIDRVVWRIEERSLLRRHGKPETGSPEFPERERAEAHA